MPCSRLTRDGASRPEFRAQCSMRSKVTITTRSTASRPGLVCLRKYTNSCAHSSCCRTKANAAVKVAARPTHEHHRDYDLTDLPDFGLLDPGGTRLPRRPKFEW